MNVNLNSHLYVSSNDFFKGNTSLSGQGETFLDAIADTLGKAKTDQPVSNTSSATAEPGLNDEDYEYLASNWNPNQMSQDEYDEVLDFLQSKGVISEDDKGYVGYKGISWIRSDRTAFCYYIPDTPVRYSAYGDFLAYIRCRSSRFYPCETADTKREINLYKKITFIMDEMVRRRNS